MERGSQSDCQGYRERTHEGNDCVERSKAERIKQRVGRYHKGHAVAHGPKLPHTNPTPPHRTVSCSMRYRCSCQISWCKGYHAANSITCNSHECDKSQRRPESAPHAGAHAPSR
eukprot:178030-Chlamydomonas_euryale.AAC.19